MAQTDPFNPNFNTYWGNEYYQTSTNTDTVNSSTFYVASKITPLVSKSVTSLQFLNWGHGGSFVAMTVELQSDSAGSPSGTVLASASYTPTSNFSWNSVSITAHSVVAGTPYWIVIHSANATSTNNLDIRRVDDPSSVLSGYDSKTSANSGSTWADNTGYKGCVGFGYSDSTYEGIGYGDRDFNTIVNNAGNQWGEYFNPPSTITISAIGMIITETGAGTPNADCSVVLENADTSTIIESGTIVAAASITTSQAWYTYTLSTNRTLNAGTNYRVYLSSANSGSPQYQVQPPKTTNTGNGNAMSFGGATQIETNISSQDASHDASFRLTLAATTTVNGNFLAFF